MSEKRFRVRFEQEDGRGEIVNEKGVELTAREVVDLLNKQQDTIITLRRRLEKINGGYGHLPHKKGLTPNEWVIEAQEKELKNKDEMISEFIERHSEDIVKISELQATIQELERKVKKYAKIGEEQLKQIIELQEENEQLRRLFEEMKQPITINLTVEDEKELRKLLGLIEDE